MPSDAPSSDAASPAPAQARPAYLVFDTESVPDGKLLSLVKYAKEGISLEQAVERAREEARQGSPNSSDFIPVTFHYPVATCVLRVGADFGLQAITCLDAPQFRPRKIVEQFWAGASHYREKHGAAVQLVTFNGRGFDLPLLELAAFRYGVAAREHFQLTRKRIAGWHLDLMEWITNFGASRMNGGLDLLSKLLGKPGKLEVKGDQVYAMFLEGKI